MRRATRPNLFIKIPGTKEGLPAIEEAIFAGIPVNVTLLFSAEHYLASAEAFLRGIERRMACGPRSRRRLGWFVFVSRWDGAVAGKVPEDLKNKLAIAVASAPTRPTRGLWLAAWAAGLQCRCPSATPLVGQHRDKGPVGFGHPVRQGSGCTVHVNTMPEGTLKALSKSRDRGAIAADGGDSDAILAEIHQGRH